LKEFAFEQPNEKEPLTGMFHIHFTARAWQSSRSHQQPPYDFL
jgi:hypothetical protein